jgi:RNA-directed DNA polymerase
VISPLLANVFLHYVLDLWVHAWRRRVARGRVTIVRFADDYVMGFQYAQDGRRMLTDLKERMAKFGLTLHEEKTRLIEFGRLPAIDHQRRGEKRLPTFAFLGFIHYCGWTHDGRFVVKRKTHSKRLYFGLPSNFRSLEAFYREVRLLWFRALRRRSQRRMSWDDFGRVLERFPLPAPRITHPCAV